MTRRHIHWLAAVGWLVTGMIVAFLILAKVGSPLREASSHAAPPVPAPSAPPPPQAAQSCDARALSQAFVGVAAKMKPGVVTIQIEKKAGGGGESPFGGGGGGPFDDFFRQFHGGRGMRPQMERGLGSGFVIDKEGHILTNNHVVDGADRVLVQTSDGRQLRGKVVGADKKDDLAVIQVKELGLPPVAFGDSDKLQVGELVMAIGSPFGFDQSVTVGVVSARGRRLDGTPYAFEDFIQTDASINHGNSGGPLVNMNGEVVGVNSRIAGEGTGIGFSVSSNVARRVAQALIRDGRVRRPYIGVSLQDLTPEMAPQFKARKGVVVNQVLPQSPAARAGLEVGDVITSVDGHEVGHSDEVVRQVQSHQVGQNVQLQVLRSGAPRQVALAAGEAPDDGKGKTAYASGGGNPGDRFGLQLEDLTPELAQETGVAARHGAVVREVEPGSPAYYAELRPGDVIVEVDRRPAAGASTVANALRGGGTHLLRVERGGAGSRFVTIGPEK